MPVLYTTSTKSHPRSRRRSKLRFGMKLPETKLNERRVIEARLSVPVSPKWTRPAMHQPESFNQVVARSEGFERNGDFATVDSLALHCEFSHITM
jgi:hypothetical protein